LGFTAAEREVKGLITVRTGYKNTGSGGKSLVPKTTAAEIIVSGLKNTYF